MVDGIEQVVDDEMQVVDVDRTNDGFIELIFDDAEVDEIGCILIIDVEFDVVNV